MSRRENIPGKYGRRFICVFFYGIFVSKIIIAFRRPLNNRTETPIVKEIVLRNMIHKRHLRPVKGIRKGGSLSKVRGIVFLSPPKVCGGGGRRRTAPTETATGVLKIVGHIAVLNFFGLRFEHGRVDDENP